MVEHWSRKPGVMGSIPIGGIFYFKQIFILYSSKGCRSWQGSNLRGQSPLDFKSNALTTRPQLPRLIPAPNTWQKVWRCGGSNPGPFTCKANALPLSYIPCVGNVDFICSNIEEDRVCMNNQQKYMYPRGDSNPQSSV